jgi:hypothetical protein
MGCVIFAGCGPMARRQGDGGETGRDDQATCGHIELRVKGWRGSRVAPLSIGARPRNGQDDSFFMATIVASRAHESAHGVQSIRRKLRRSDGHERQQHAAECGHDWFG